MICFTKIDLPSNINYESLEDIQGKIIEQYDTLNKDYARFKMNAAPILSDVRRLFSEKSDPDPVSIKDDLESYIQYSFTLGQYIIWAEQFLRLYELLYFCPKRQKVSENDRKQYTQIKCLEQSSLLVTLQTYEAKVDKKITILQSRMKAEIEKARKFGDHG